MKRSASTLYLYWEGNTFITPVINHFYTCVPLNILNIQYIMLLLCAKWSMPTIPSSGTSILAMWSSEISVVRMRNSETNKYESTSFMAGRALGVRYDHRKTRTVAIFFVFGLRRRHAFYIFRWADGMCTNLYDNVHRGSGRVVAEEKYVGRGWPTASEKDV